MNIRDTQSLTKFLRSKDGSLDDILDVSNQVLNNKLSFNLPNGHLFILQLICDRINDSNKFKLWKFDHRVWSLFNYVFTRIEDIQARDRTIRRIKLLDVLSNIFDQFYDVKGVTFFDQLLDATNNIVSRLDIQPSESSCLNFIGSFTNIYQSDLNDTTLLKWSQTAYKVFNTCQVDLEYSWTKKSTTRFFSETLKKLLTSIQNLDDSARECKVILSKIIRENIFTKELMTGFTGNVSLFLKLKPSQTSVYLLYQTIIDKIGNRDIKLSEELYLLIVKIPEYNDMSEKLIEVLSTSNKPLSTGFFETIFSQTIQGKKINWNLISHIINLDVSLAMEKSSIMVEKLNQEPPHLAISFIPSLVEAFVRARDLFEFCTQTWYKNMARKDWWKSEYVISAVAAHIDDFSGAQLQKLIQFIYENKTESTPIFQALVRGLVHCSIDKLSTIEDTLWADSDYILHGTSWVSKYYLLVSYGGKYDMFADLDLLPSSNDLYFYLFIFRVTELKGVSLLNEEICLKFMDFIKQQEPDVLIVLLQRWSIIISQFFTSFSSEIMKLCIDKLPYEFWTSFFKERAQMFFEQTNLVNSFAKQVPSRGEYYDLISLIPIQCFERNIKVELINKLSASNISPSALKKLLVMPTFKSSIETDFSQLVNLLQFGSQYNDVFKLVWAHHLSQAKTEHSTVDDSLKNLRKSLSKDFRISSPNVIAAGLVLESTDKSSLPDKVCSRYMSLEAKYTESLMKASKDIIAVNSPLDSIKAYLSLVDNIIRPSDDFWGSKDLKKVGSIICKYEDRDLSVLFYKIFCRINDIGHFKHVVALYVALYTPEDDILDSTLTNYLERVSGSLHYDEIIYFIFESMTHTINDFNAPIFLSLCGILMKTFKKDKNCELKLGIMISIVSNQIPKFTASLKPIRLFLKSIRSALTDVSWCFTQYSIEQVLALISKISKLTGKGEYPSDDLEETFILSTQVAAHILLFHRFRLTSRHHLVISVFTALMKPLTIKSNLNDSPACASAYTRLLGNLCEPSNSKYLVNDQLTTASTIIKKHLRNYIPVLIVNYVSLSLTQNFSRENNNEIKLGIFNILDVISPRELEAINNWLDSQGIVFFKSLYNDYKDYGKWKDT